MQNKLAYENKVSCLKKSSEINEQGQGLQAYTVHL